MKNRARSGKRILIVDDEIPVADSIRMVVTILGHTGTVLHEPGKALELAGREHFDLVLTDYLMRGMNGSELARRIKQASPSTPVVLITGCSNDLQFDEVDAVLFKPMNLAEVETVLTRLLTQPS
jgi:CheY-like chemotaxis protein